MMILNGDTIAEADYQGLHAELCEAVMKLAALNSASDHLLLASYHAWRAVLDGDDHCDLALTLNHWVHCLSAAGQESHKQARRYGEQDIGDGAGAAVLHAV